MIIDLLDLLFDQQDKQHMMKHPGILEHRNRQNIWYNPMHLCNLSKFHSNTAMREQTQFKNPEEEFAKFNGISSHYCGANKR